ncbi:MAG: SDR family NAD(P)-dependent oxidoreductase [Bacteroidetes bacterium]|nr:SDR family NAD(P)-dependent oxidoreductase [Bacteroidota bacterium]
MNFKDKVVLITGGSRGIGKATAVAFAKHGASVAITYSIDDKAAQDALSSLTGNSHFMIKADVRFAQESKAAVTLVIEKYGRLDILVNNAGVYIPHPIDESGFDEWEEAWEKTMAVNLFGPAHMTYFTVREMIRLGGGRIVNVTSRGAFRGEPDHPAYGASKAALNSFSQSMAKALGKYHIYVTALAPGYVETEMTTELLDGQSGIDIRLQSPLNRAAKPEEIAYAILMLASEGSEYMTGAILDMNGASYLRT